MQNICSHSMQPAQKYPLRFTFINIFFISSSLWLANYIIHYFVVFSLFLVFFFITQSYSKVIFFLSIENLKPHCVRDGLCELICILCDSSSCNCPYNCSVRTSKPYNHACNGSLSDVLYNYSSNFDLKTTCHALA